MNKIELDKVLKNSFDENVRYIEYYKCLICNKKLRVLNIENNQILRCENKHYWSLDEYMKKYINIIVGGYEYQVENKW